MSTTTNRMMIAIIAVIFAAATTSCKKENNVTPTPNPSVNTPPSIPVTPAVSPKPTFILTTENGSAIRKETYKYDAQGKLKSYESSSASSGTDSVIMLSNSVSYRLRTSVRSSAFDLFFNTDKSFKEILNTEEHLTFQNDATKLNTASLVNPNGSITRAAEFTYTNNNLSKIRTEVSRIDINYFNDLPYQKGINEIPKTVKPITLFKVLEQENATSTVLYNKLIKQIILTRGSQVVETHDYTYGFDASNKVTSITDLITNTTNGTQRTVLSTITYKNKPQNHKLFQTKFKF